LAVVALHYTGLLPLAALVAGVATVFSAVRLLGERFYRAAVAAGLLAATAAGLLVLRGAGGSAAVYVALGYGVLVAGIAASIVYRGGPEKLYKAMTLLLVAGWLVYWVPFVTLDFTLHEVFWNTSEGLPLWMRFAAAWSGGGGSLFLFALLAGLGGYYIIRSRGEPRRRALLLAGSALVAVVGLAAAFLNDAFTLLENPPAGGAGLNPLLKSPWLYPHPLSTFGGYALLAVAAVGLLAGGVERRSWIVYELGWALLTVGIMLGGYWSYETFGWGGYWAWDPVETSELMVWLAATLLPHVYVAARSLSGFTAALMGSSVFLAMYVTRTGLSPLHSFAAPGIGALILLGTAVAMLGYAVYRLSLDIEAPLRGAGLPRRPARLPRSLSPYRAGMIVAAAALLASSLFVYATLFVPSLLLVAGRQASVPQMEAGVQYFHPVLYPLLIAMLAAIPAAFLGDVLGWRGLAALLGSTALLSAALGYAAYTGLYSLAPLSSRLTNALMGFGLPWAGVAAAATLLYLYRSLRRRGPVALLADRMAPMSLLHLGLAVTVVGVLLSGTYAFNDAYTWELHLKPGERVVVPGNHTIELVSYEFHISSSKVDIFTNYVGRSPVYFYAQMTLQTMANTLGKYFHYYVQGERIVEENATLQRLFMISRESPYTAPAVEAEATVNATIYTVVAGEQGATLQPMPLYLGGARVELVNASVNIFASVNDEGIEPVAWLVATVAPDLMRISLENNLSIVPKKHLAQHDFLELRFDPPLEVRVNESLALEIRWARVLPELLVTGGRGQPINITSSAVAAANPLLLVYDGDLVYDANGSSVRIPLQLPTPVAGYLAVLQDDTLLSLLLYVNRSSIFKLLSDPEAILNITVPRGVRLASPGGVLGYVEAPRLVPETAWLDIVLRVDGSQLERFRIRFEAYGEIQGIHGLVSKVIHPARGLDDVYVVVSPPVDPGDITGSPYHALLLYYLHEVFKELTPEQRLALAALMAAGYNIDMLERMQPGDAAMRLMGSVIDLYVMAESYKPGSLIEQQGLNVQVKIIPGVRLVWLGPVLMGASVVLAALSSLRRGGGGG